MEIIQENAQEFEHSKNGSAIERTEFLGYKSLHLASRRKTSQGRSQWHLGIVQIEQRERGTGRQAERDRDKFWEREKSYTQKIGELSWLCVECWLDNNLPSEFWRDCFVVFLHPNFCMWALSLSQITLKNHSQSFCLCLSISLSIYIAYWFVLVLCLRVPRNKLGGRISITTEEKGRIKNFRKSKNLYKKGNIAVVDYLA